MGCLAAEMRAVVFSTEVEGPGRVRTARIGHVFECADGSRRRVLALDSGDPVCVLLEGGGMFTVPAGAVLRTEDADMPAPVRTEKPPSKRAEPVVSVHPGAVRSIVYHTGANGPRTVAVGDLIDGRLRLTQIVVGDPVHVTLLDARGETTSRAVCGAGSVAVWRYA
jgi:hypothetical protein